jgi:hypothetical protein
MDKERQEAIEILTASHRSGLYQQCLRETNKKTVRLSSGAL